MWFLNSLNLYNVTKEVHMSKELKHFSTHQNAIYFSSENIKSKTSMPFKHHVQFPVLVDTLIRKNNHHLILNIDIPNNMYTLFLEAFLAYLQENHIPHQLRACECIYLPLDKMDFIKNQQKMMEENLKLF